MFDEDIRRFEQLATFPEDKDIPLSVLEKLWGSGSFATKKLCGQLHDLSLLLRFDLQAGTIRLHDVIRAYLLKKGESHLVAWHRHLLDTCRPANGRWPDLPRDESYLWSHLIHHLLGAGQSDVCRTLLLDFHYLRSKLSATDVNALLADYSLFAEKDQELRLVRDALRLRLWDVESGQILKTLEEHFDWIDAVAVLDRRRVVSGSDDGTLRVWDVESGQTLRTHEGHSAGVHAVAVLDDRQVVSGSNDETLRVWDVESGQTLRTLKGHSNQVRTVAVLGRRQVVSGSDDLTLRVTDWESGHTLQTLEGHSNRIRAVAVLDRRRAVSGSEDRMLRVWDVESGQTLQILEGHSGAVFAVAVLDRRRVASGSSDRTLRVWDVESGQVECLFTLEAPVFAVAVIPERRVIVAGDQLGRVHFFDFIEGGDPVDARMVPRSTPG